MIEKAKFAVRFYTFRSQTHNDDICVFFMNNDTAASETDSAKSEEQGIHTAKKALTCLDTHFNGQGHCIGTKIGESQFSDEEIGKRNQIWDALLHFFEAQTHRDDVRLFA